MIAADGSGLPASVEEDRRHLMEAAIVRVMKVTLQLIVITKHPTSQTIVITKHPTSRLCRISMQHAACALQLWHALRAIARGRACMDSAATADLIVVSQYWACCVMSPHLFSTETLGHTHECQVSTTRLAMLDDVIISSYAQVSEPQCSDLFA